MRKLEQRYEVRGLSLEEICGGLGAEVKRLQIDVKYNGTAISPAHLISGLVLSFLRLPPDERIVVAQRVVADLEKLANKPAQQLSNWSPETSNSGSASSPPVRGSKGRGGRKLPPRKRKDAASVPDNGPFRLK